MPRYHAAAILEESGNSQISGWTVHDDETNKPVLATLTCTRAQAFLIAEFMNIADVNARGRRPSPAANQT